MKVIIKTTTEEKVYTLGVGTVIEILDAKTKETQTSIQLLNKSTIVMKSKELILQEEEELKRVFGILKEKEE